MGRILKFNFMKTITFYVAIIIFNLGMHSMLGQTEGKTTSESDSITNKSEYLEKQKEQIIQEEKERLKDALSGINYQLEKKFITSEEARELREKAARKHALNIENRIAILENNLALQERNPGHTNSISIFDNGKVVNIDLNDKGKRPYDRRTTSDIVLAFGLNNAISDANSLDDSDFKIAGSRFFEIGWAWKTRVFENSNWLRLKYGVSFQFNGLKPTDNRYFVEEDELTVLREFPVKLDKSKFRMDNLVVPVHFEFGPSKRTETERYFRYSTNGMFKFGIGGYAGVNIGERQKLKYEIDGEKRKDKLKGDYNTNELVYGISSYISLGGTALYAKYDLNPIFKDPNMELHNVSLGLRFDLD